MTDAGPPAIPETARAASGTGAPDVDDRFLSASVADVVGDPARLQALHDSGVLDPDENETFQRLTRVAAHVLRVPVSLVSFVDYDRQLFSGCVGLPEPTASERQTPLSHSFCQYVVATDEPLVVDDAREHPVLRDNLALRDLDVVAYLGVPLRDPDGKVLGSFCAIDHEARTWTAAEVGLLQDLAAAAMTEIALMRAVLDEHRARTEALRANMRLEHLNEASAMLAGSLDFAETLDNIVQLLVPDHADWGVIDLLRDGAIQRMSLVAAGAQRQQAARRLLEQYPPSMSDPYGVGQVLRSGRTQVTSVVDDDFVDRVSRGAQHRELVEQLGVASVVIAPMRVGAEVVGALSLVSATPGRYDQHVVPFISELAGRVGLAIENARLYEERDVVARTLQASLLPDAVPQPPGLEAAARYRAARGGSEVGGDFYDLFDVGGGRWMAVVGDVRGKGVPAAALTGLARHTIRGAALRDPDPAQVLATLNHALLIDTPSGLDEDPRFCTVVCALIEPRPSGAVLQLACAGHPPAIIVRAAGGVERLGGDGTLLGVLDDIDVTVAHSRLGSGDNLVLYTDGVTEARIEGAEFFGEERLTAALQTSPKGAQEAASRVTGAVMAWQHGVARDDIAVLAVSVPPAA